MEVVVKELQQDAQLGVFFASDCNVSAIASEIVGRDAAAVGGKQQVLTHSDSSDNSNANGFALDGDHAAASHSERFILRIDDAVRKIDRVITDHIGDNHSALLDHVGSTDELQSRVTTVQTSVRHLKGAVRDLETVVQTQHAKLETSIRKHRHVDKCSDIVRRLLRFHQLAERVLGSTLSVVTGPTTGGRSRAASTDHVIGTTNSNSDGASELATLALAIREVETLVTDAQFEDLSVVRARLPSLRRVGAAIRRDARATLRSGMQRLSQADVGDALQVLFYLGHLSESVQSTVNDVIQDVERKCAAAISEDALVRAAGGSNTSGAAEATAQRADVWQAIQDVFENVRSHALQVWNLERVLVKMRDARSGRAYIDLVLERDEPALCATFWDVTCALVRELFGATLQYRAPAKLVLVASYPRMRDDATRVLDELAAATQPTADAALLADAVAAVVTVSSDTSNSSAASHTLRPIAGSVAERNQLLDAMAPLLEAFTDRAYRRLANPIQLMFPQSTGFHASAPGRSDMQTLARTMFAEVDQAGRDAVLLDAVLQQIRKAIALFCSSVQRIANTGRAATATTPTLGRSPAQAHNVALLSVLHQLDNALDEVVTRASAAALPAPVGTTDSSAGSHKELEALCTREIGPCREQLQDLAFTLLGTYLQALSAILESIIAKMHDESFADTRASSSTGSNTVNGMNSSNGGSGSRYMSEFSSAFHVVLDEHIKRLPNAPFAAACVRDFVARLISVFVRHAALLRPLEEAGKLRLANDMAQLELRLEPLLPLKSLGAPYDELRAFRHMVFLETSSSVMRDPTIDRVRPSNVWHHLMARAPVELELPHQMKRWSAAKYVEWLDTRAGLTTRLSPTGSSSSAGTPKLSDALAVAKVPLGYPCLKDRRMALLAEQEAWKEVVACLDAYAQRVSATADVPISAIYDTLLESGAILLAGYEMSLAR